MIQGICKRLAAMNGDSKIFVAGHNGLVGSSIVRRLRSLGYKNLILRERAALDLTDRRLVDSFFSSERPEYVFLAAAKVGGILANATHPAEFIRDNLLIQTNVIDASHQYGAAKIEFGSSCIYPKNAPQPIKEEYLLTDTLEPTNEAYAIAKIAGLTMVKAYHSQYGMNGVVLMPTNLYGPEDNFDLQSAHVLPALLRKMHEAKRDGSSEAVISGSGNARREFLHVDDLADAAVFLMNEYDNADIINVGVGVDTTIRELAETIARVVGFNGRLAFDTSKPDGTPRKLLDVSRCAALGWTPKIDLETGIRTTYAWYLAHYSDAS